MCSSRAFATTSSPDTDALKVAGPEGGGSLARHVLPKDLAGALAQLSDAELGRLLAAAMDEAKRRDRLRSSRGTKATNPHRTVYDAPLRNADVTSGPTAGDHRSF